MATGDDIQWWCRTDGDDTNGGGFDSGIPSAGTNYCDQAAAELSLTDLATSGAGVTTITSVTGGFTSAMIGNSIRIASGTNFTAGYYWITGYTDTNTITVSVSPTPSAAGSAGNGKIGGAFLGLKNLMAGASGGLSNPTITSPLAAGHRINLGGTGGDDPGTGGGVAPTGMDYDYRGSASSYQGFWTPTAQGSTVSGRIKIVGYKQGGGTGRPCIGTSGLLLNNASFWHLENLKFIFTHTAGLTAHGIFAGNQDFKNTVVNVIVDVNGLDADGLTVYHAYNCEVRNTGGTTAGTRSGIKCVSYPAVIVGCVVRDVRGNGFSDGSQSSGYVNCIADSCKANGFVVASSAVGAFMINCTAYNCTGDGVAMTTATACTQTSIINCTLESNGSNAIDCRVGTSLLNDKRRAIWVTNNAYNSATLYNAVTAPDTDLNVDSQFTNAANGDLSVGTNLKAKGSPKTFRSGEVTSYVDIGAVQRQEPTVAGVFRHPGMSGGMNG